MMPTHANSGDHGFYAGNHPHQSIDVTMDLKTTGSDLSQITPKELAILRSLDKVLDGRQKLIDVTFKNGKMVLKHWLEYETASQKGRQSSPSPSLLAAMEWFEDYEKRKRAEAAQNAAGQRSGTKREKPSEGGNGAAGSFTEVDDLYKMATKEISDQFQACQDNMAEHDRVMEGEDSRLEAHSDAFCKEHLVRYNMEADIQTDVQELMAIMLVMYKYMNGNDLPGILVIH